MGTIRQQIVELLKSKPMSSFTLAHEVGSSEKSVEDHLQHVAKSVGPALEMTPSECRDCGFVFAKRDRTSKPTKCPKCRSESIFPPLFFIKEEKRSEK